MEPSALQKSMKMAMSKCKQSEEDEQMTRKKNKVDWFVFLSDETLETILKRLPVTFLRYKAKHVCKRWFNIITYRILLEHASFIVQMSSGPHIARHFIVREEKQCLTFKVEFLEIPYKGRIKSWCNEFLLIIDPDKRESLYIFNLYTKEGFYLPQCPSSCGGHYTCKCGLCLSFDGFKGVYKVLHVFMGPPIQFRILVLSKGIASRVPSKWKTIELPSYIGEKQHYWGDPVSVQGRYFHWHVHCPKYLVSMDMVKEEFSQIRLPGSDDDRMRSQYSLVEMSGFLALLDKGSSNKVDIWILKDFERMKWEKFKSLSLWCDWYLGMYPVTHLPFPICSVINKRYVIFRKPGRLTRLYSYNLETNIMKRIDMMHPVDKFVNRYVVHSVAPSFV